MPLKAGSVNDFENSMAAAISTAFSEQWPQAMGDQAPPDGTSQTRLLFAAIARGIITYLRENSESFEVSVTLPDNTTVTGVVSDISVFEIEGNLQ